MLTESADRGAKFTGTKKGDVFNADSFVSGGKYLPTLNLSDELDGGAGKDTLNITSDDSTAAYKMADATIKNIETITIKGAHDVTADVSGSNITDLETISVLKSANATVTAAATTDVNVSGATDDITVQGGNDITITDNTAASSITVKDTTGNYATGKIKITDTKFGVGEKIDVDGGTDVTVTATADKVNVGTITVGANETALGDVKIVNNTTNNATTALDINAGNVTVTGGKTVEITANMTNTAVKAGTTDIDIIAGIYTVTADNITTDVTITQNATATNFENDAAEIVKETSVVTFNEMKATEKLIINGLTFTASKDLTAAEVAAAFANLTADDTQSATGITANGIYSGTFSAVAGSVWTSAAANGATVTFTAINENQTDLTFIGSAATNDAGARIPTQVISAGTAAGANTAVTVTKNFGAVVVDDNATKSITTITLNGFDGAALGKTTPATTSLDKLATLNLANGTGTTELTSSVATLNVTLNDMAGTVDLDATAATTLKTLNLTTTGEASTITLDAKKVETLTIDAGANLNISATVGTGLAALKTATITGAGNVTLGTLSTVNTFTTLTASAATGDISASVDGDVTAVTTGSGDDSITLLSTGTFDKAINLGAGDDTLTLTDDTTAIPTAAVNGGADTDTISMTFASAISYGGAELFKNAISGFERLEINNVYTGGTADTQETLTLDLANLGFTSYVITSGTLIDADNAATESDILKLTKLAANATVVLTAQGYIEAVLATATGTADVLNIITDAATTLNAGSITVDDVETINIDAQQDTTSLILAAADAKTVNVTGNSDIVLSTGIAHANLKTVDASDMTGALTYTIDSTVTVVNFELTSGSGDDDITVDTSNNAQVKTGEGDDKITVEDGAVSANIWGGAGKNTFDVINTISSAAQYVTIEDAKSGDQIILGTDTFLSGSVSITDFDKIGLSQKFDAVLTDTVLNTVHTTGFAISFQHTGNTYIVVSDGNGTIDFSGATGDQIIKLTGLKDLSAGASYNATSNTLEIA